MGMLSFISGSPFGTGAGPLSIAIDPTDAFAFVANNPGGSLGSYALTAASGALTPVSGSPFAAGTNPEALTVHPTGSFLFAADAGAANQVTTYGITPGSGALTLLSSAAADLLPIALSLDPAGHFLYAVNYNSGNVSGYTVGASGALTPVPGSPFAVGAQPHAIAID